MKKSPINHVCYLQLQRKIIVPRIYIEYILNPVSIQYWHFVTFLINEIPDN